MTQKITTFLAYKDHAEEAVRLYTSLFKDSRIVNTMSAPDGKVLGIEFDLAGQRYSAMNGGPSFSFAEGISLSVSCETQEEIDRYWSALTANGGEPGRCGWLKDPFGVSWQIVPRVLGELLGDQDRAKSGRATQAMLKMDKLDIAELKKAHAG
jgi:predicted 3-demethylubiquinone-9 3-methyltransferase (glyoxalase superfamily)